MTLFHPTYGFTAEGLDVNEAVGCEPTEDLADITDVCATYGVEAVLRDAAGFTIGHVKENGDYRLGT
jgi:hypothetical protein